MAQFHWIPMDDMQEFKEQLAVIGVSVDDLLKRMADDWSAQHQTSLDKSETLVVSFTFVLKEGEGAGEYEEEAGE